MTETEKKLYAWIKDIHNTDSGVHLGFMSFNGVCITDMSKEELVLLCNILGNEFYRKDRRIKVLIELETEC